MNSDATNDSPAIELHTYLSEHYKNFAINSEAYKPQNSGFYYFPMPTYQLLPTIDELKSEVFKNNKNHNLLKNVYPS